MTDAPREMAAVMFTDVQGYSSLAQRDEALALRLLGIKRRLADPIIAGHHGRLIKTIGDALMVEFKSALAAVQCATQLQKKLYEHNQSVPEKERFLVRMGVHVGDVVREDGDLLGDTVNIAARVESEAPAGGIALTQAVYDQIRGKFDLPLLSLGGQKLKGIEGETALYAVKLPWQDEAPLYRSRSGLVARLKQHHMFRVASWYATVAYVLILAANAVFPDVGYTREDVRYLIASLALGFPVVLTLSWMLVPPSKENPEHFSRWRRLRWRLGAAVSLMVIAFVTVSGVYLWYGAWLRAGRVTPAEDHAPGVVVLRFEKLGAVDDTLIDGIRDNIEGTLSGIGGVRLISQSALPDEKGASPTTLAGIAHATGATYAIQGSVQRADAKSAITVHTELVSVDGGQSLLSWTSSYGPDTPSAAIQQETSTEITGPVRALSQPRGIGLAPGFPTTSNPEALRMLRQARLNDDYNGSDDPTQMVREALRMDPRFAQAHAYLAFFMAFRASDAASADLAGIDHEIATAEALDPGLPEAAFARGMRQGLTGDYAAAVKAFDSAAAALVDDADFHLWRGDGLEHLGRWDEALAEYQQAVALDPYMYRPAGRECFLLFGLRRYDAAKECIASFHRVRPRASGPVFWGLAVDFAQHGDVAKLKSGFESTDWNGTAIATYPNWSVSWLNGTRLQIAHLESRHQDVLDGLKLYPEDCVEYGTLNGPLLGRSVCVTTFTAESLRLMGRDLEAVAAVRLSLTKAEEEMRAAPQDDGKRIRVALLQAFGMDAASALATLEPLRKRLERPVSTWTIDDAWIAADAAVVLAWSGRSGDAIGVLQGSLTVPHGTSAAILAHDPVWRPLYTQAAFQSLLAAHGETLVYAK